MRFGAAWRTRSSLQARGGRRQRAAGDQPLAGGAAAREHGAGSTRSCAKSGRHGTTVRARRRASFVEVAAALRGHRGVAAAPRDGRGRPGHGRRSSCPTTSPPGAPSCAASRRTALVGEGRGRVARATRPHRARRHAALPRAGRPRDRAAARSTTRAAATLDVASRASQAPRASSWTARTSHVSRARHRRRGGHVVIDVGTARPDAGRVRIEARAIGGRGCRRGPRWAWSDPAARHPVVEGRTGVVDTTRGAARRRSSTCPRARSRARRASPSCSTRARRRAARRAALPRPLPVRLRRADGAPLPAGARRAARPARGGEPRPPRGSRALDEAVRRGARCGCATSRTPTARSAGSAAAGATSPMTAYALLGLAGAREAGVPDLDDAIIDRAATRSRGSARRRRRGRARPRALALAARRAHRDRGLRHDVPAPERRSLRGRARLDGAGGPAPRRGYDADELVGLLLERTRRGRTARRTGRASRTTASSAATARRRGSPCSRSARGRARSSAGRARSASGCSRTACGAASARTKDTAAFVGAASRGSPAHGAQAFGGTLERAARRRRRAHGRGRSGRASRPRTAASWSSGRERLDAGAPPPRVPAAWAGRAALGGSPRDASSRARSCPAETHGLAIDAPLPATRGGARRRAAGSRQARLRDPAPRRAAAGRGAPARGREHRRPRARAARGQTRRATSSTCSSRIRCPRASTCSTDTAAGPFDWQERRDDRQVFFCSKLAQGHDRASSTSCRRPTGAASRRSAPRRYAMYLPEVHGRGRRPRRSRSSRSDGARRRRGARAHARRALRARPDALRRGERASPAAVAAARCRDEQPLRDEIVEEIETPLLRVAVEEDDAKEIVRAREALVRRNPARIPRRLARRSGRSRFAYHDAGRVRDGARASTATSSRAASASRWTGCRRSTKRGREVEGLDALGAGARGRFPISNATADAAFRAAQRYRELPASRGPRPAQAGRPMDEETLDALWAFTAHFAETPLADAGELRPRRARCAARATGRRRRLRPRRSWSASPAAATRTTRCYFLAESRFRTFEEEPDAGARRSAVRDAAKPLVEAPVPGGRAAARRRASSARGPGTSWRVSQHVLGDLDRGDRATTTQARELEDAREAYAFLTEERLDLDADRRSLPARGRRRPARSGTATSGRSPSRPTPWTCRSSSPCASRLRGSTTWTSPASCPPTSGRRRSRTRKDHWGTRARSTLPVEAGTARGLAGRGQGRRPRGEDPRGQDRPEGRPPAGRREGPGLRHGRGRAERHGRPT